VGFFHGVIDSHLQNTSAAARQESGISQEQASNHAASFASLGILADPNIQRNTLFIRIHRQHAVPSISAPSFQNK
jgi:flagellar motor switch protein FliG